MVRSALPLLLLSVLVAAVAAPALAVPLLDDPAGDVTVRTFEQQDTPAAGWEAMDLVGLDAEELPDVLRFTVAAAGLEGTADYDAGNYFVYLQRGTVHYTLRMAQDNAGTAVLVEVLRTEGRDVFGEVLTTLEGSVDAAAGTITTDVPRDLLLDEDGAVPAKGGSLTGIVVSAEAHATGVYSGGFMDLEGGPAIVGDRMPDAFDDGASMAFRFGGGTSDGPVALTIERPYRASNGEATIYVYTVTASNGGDAGAFHLDADGLPDGWEVRFPGDRLELDAGENATFDAYLRVPFRHVHGATDRAELVLTSEADPETWARGELGVHYLATAQPSGHHPTVFLHSAQRVGLGGGSAIGDGDNALFWNTLEDDDRDTGLPLSGTADGTAFRWSGCLSPGLALGVTPAAVPGRAELTLDALVAMEGTLTGRLSVVQADHGAYCHRAELWDAARVEIAVLDPLAVSLDGPTALEAALLPARTEPVPFEPGMDLLLELTFTPDHPVAYGEGVDLLTGGRLDLPLLDHHEAAPDVLPGDDGTAVAAPEAFVEEPEAVEESPGVGVLAVLGVAVVVALRRRG